VLTPSSLEVQVGSINGLFNLDEVKVFTALDKKRVTHTQQILSLQLHPLYASTGCLTLLFLSNCRKQLPSDAI